MENKAFTNFFAILLTLLQFVLWLLPAYMVVNHYPSEWAILYLPLFIMALIWGNMMQRKYF